jgi:predicted enzyme related to lactoylglutathione lyase
MVEIHVYIEVDDVDRGAAFYNAAVGLHVRRRLAERWIELEGAGVPVFMHTHRDREPASFGRHWTPVHLDFIVPALPEAIERAVAAGGVLEKEVDHEGYFKMANFADPWGNGFDLIELYPGGYDRIAAEAATG